MNTKQAPPGLPRRICAGHRRSATLDVHPFTLVEALVSLVLLAIVAVTIPAVYQVGLQSAAEQQRQSELTMALTNQIEQFLNQSFDSMQSGNSPISVAGQSYTIGWTVIHPDLDGDGVAEPTVKQVQMRIDNTSMSVATLIFDSTDQLDPY